jgi:hypothetical protein
MGLHTIGAVLSVPMEGVLLAHPTTLHMRENSTASITISNFSRRKGTTASLRMNARKIQSL